MDRKNVNRGFKKLRVWQDAVSLYVLACNIFADFPFELKKVAANSIDAAHSVSRNIAVELVPHSCKSRFCPTCGKHATDVWASQVLNGLLDVAYHHLIMAIPWQLRIVIMMNRKAGLNLICQAATEAVQQWARDIKKMRMGILVVIHTFGADMKWHPHIHLIVTGGGLSLDGKRWIRTDPRFLMYHGGLKKRWKYQVCTRMKKAHRQDQWRFPKSKHFLTSYPHFASMINKLWPNCDQPLTLMGSFFGNWQQLQFLFDTAGKDAYIAPALLKPG